MSDDMNMEDVYAKLAKAREKKLEARQEHDEEKKRKKIARDHWRNRRNRDGDSEQARLKHMQVTETPTTKRRSPRLSRHRRRLLRMGMTNRSRIVLLPTNKKYAGMLTVEMNLQSYLYVRVMKKITILNANCRSYWYARAMKKKWITMILWQLLKC
jgi:hypothetical protein